MTPAARYPRMAQIADVKASLRVDDHDGWILMDGRTLKKAERPLLFAALGITAATWAMPDFRNRAFIGTGTLADVGKADGTSELTLTLDQIPAHDHGFSDSTAEAATGKGGLLAGVLTVFTGLSAKTVQGTTAKSGGGKPVKLPAPPHVKVGVFLFAGGLR